MCVWVYVYIKTILKLFISLRKKKRKENASKIYV